MYTFLADENLAALDEYFSPFGRIITKAGSQIKARDLLGVDALLVRSVTKINASLVQYHQPEFIGSATIGTDHIAFDELSEYPITIANAPGCNATAVAEYVLCALFALRKRYSLKLETLTFAIVGMGHVGQRLRNLLTVSGIKTIAYDPLLIDQTGLESSLQKLCHADVLSLHVPLTCDTSHPTKHLINADVLKYLKPGAVIINTSRGGVLDVNQFVSMKGQKKFISVFDVWPIEPVIDKYLIDHTDIATPHIAGYSYEGKLRGTFQLYQAWLKHINSANKEINSMALDIQTQQEKTLNVQFKGDIYAAIGEVLNSVYDIWQDDKKIRALDLTDNCINFEGLRKDYCLRREFAAFKVKLTGKHIETVSRIIKQLGFKVLTNG